MDQNNKKTVENELPKIGKPATRALNNAGYYQLEQLTNITESQLLNLHGVGPKAIKILNEALKEKGLSILNK